MCYLNIRGVDYFVEMAGAGRPWLLLHGFTGSSRNWQRLWPALAARHQVIAVDLPGHGRTAAPPDPHRYTIAQVAADLATLLAHLHLAQAGLLGYSMGGRLALFTAVTYPHLFPALVLESASPGLKTAAARRARTAQDEALANWIEAHGIGPFVERWEGLPLWRSQEKLPLAARQALRQQRLQNTPAGLANSLRGMGTGTQPSLWGALPALLQPVLLLAGALDEKFVAINREMAALLPHGRLTTVPEAGHTIHLERPSLFQRLVTDFWQESA